MKSTFQCIVISLLCSGRVFCEIELFPDFQRSENPNKQWKEEDVQETAKEPPYEDRTRNLIYPSDYVLPPPISWPNVPARPTHPFHLKNVNYGSRLVEIAKQLKDVYRKPNYDHANANKLISNVYEQMSKNGHFDQFMNPNLRILDDVRHTNDQRQSDTSSGLDFKETLFDESAEEYENSGREIDEESPIEKSTTWKNAEDSSDEFAYLPTDPRYYQTDDQNIDQKNSKVEIMKNVEKPRETPPMSADPRNRVFQEIPKSRSEYQKFLIGTDVKMIPIDSQGIDDTTGMYVIAVIAGISAAATVGMIAFGIGWYNLQKHVKNASDVDYPAYGVTGPNKEISPATGDRRLAQSAQMYHYQHQKQQIIAMERAATTERQGSVSEADSDEENEEGDYTVYECPGLAPTGEMEVKNPLFQDDPTPAQISSGTNNEEETK